MTDEPTQPQPSKKGSILTGSVRRTLFKLALPIFLQQILMSMVSFYDTYLSGNLPGDIDSSATSAIGVAAYVGWLVSMMFGLVGAGTTALVSRHWGAGEQEQANETTNCSFVLALMMGTISYVFIVTTAPLFAHGLDLDEVTARIAIDYLRLDAIGLFFTAISAVSAAALRGKGDTITPMFIFGWVSIMNMISSYAFVYGIGPWPLFGIESQLTPALGVNGIVYGTIVARVSGGLMIIVWLISGKSGLRLQKKYFKLNIDLTRRLTRIGVPAAVDGMVMWSCHFLFLKVISNLSVGAEKTAMFATHVIGIRLESITYMPAFAWGMAAATMVGQALGARNSKRAVRAGHEAALQCGLLGAAITVVFFFGADFLFRNMHQDPLVWAIGPPPFRMVALFQIPLIISIVYISALRGAGDTRFPLLITLVSGFLVRLPAAYIFGIVFDGGLWGAWFGMSADMFLRAALAAWRYFGKKWTSTVV